MQEKNGIQLEKIRTEEKTERSCDMAKNKYGKFTVNCTFAGDKSITELMTCYIDRKVSLKHGG